MPEISLSLLDVAQNSVKAGAKNLILTVRRETSEQKLYTSVADDGCGMDEETVKKVVDPFYTTRTTRKVGLGIPFLKQAAEITGGVFSMKSEKGVGTLVEASFCTDSIDCMPLGDMNSTVRSLIQCNPDLRTVYRYEQDGRLFELDTLQLRDILGDVPLNTPEVMAFLKEYMSEQTQRIEKGEIKA